MQWSENDGIFAITQTNSSCIKIHKRLVYSLLIIARVLCRDLVRVWHTNRLLVFEAILVHLLIRRGMQVPFLLLPFATFTALRALAVPITLRKLSSYCSIAAQEDDAWQTAAKDATDDSDGAATDTDIHGSTTPIVIGIVVIVIRIRVEVPLFLLFVLLIFGAVLRFVAVVVL